MRIAFDSLPRIYELSWVPNTSSIELLIHKEVLDEIFSKPRPENWPVTKHLQTEQNLGEFTADSETGFGFGENRLVRKPDRSQFAVFTITLPVIEVETGICQECKGKKSRHRRECLYCNGRGKSREYRHISGKLVTINLALVLTRLSCIESQPATTHNQLATLELGAAERSMHGYPLWGAFSVDMVRWLASNGERVDLLAVKETMKQAFVRMYPSDASETQFRAWSEPDGRFNFSVPGDCACLHADHGSWDSLKEGLGYQFSTHNVDTPAQQLSLLVGIITLWEQARKEIYQEN